MMQSCAPPLVTTSDLQVRASFRDIFAIADPDQDVQFLNDVS
jgi:hypothetical protein